MKSKVSPEELTGKEMIRRKTQQVKVKDFRGWHGIKESLSQVCGGVAVCLNVAKRAEWLNHAAHPTTRVRCSCCVRHPGKRRVLRSLYMGGNKVCPEEKGPQFHRSSAGLHTEASEGGRSGDVRSSAVLLRAGLSRVRNSLWRHRRERCCGGNGRTADCRVPWPQTSSDGLRSQDGSERQSEHASAASAAG